MTAPDHPSAVVGVAMVIALFLFAPGCSPGASGSGGPDDDPAGIIDSLELECVQGLDALDAAIEKSSTDTQISPAALHEARALRETAGELYLEAHFQLALELIDEALALLGRT